VHLQRCRAWPGTQADTCFCIGANRHLRSVSQRRLEGHIYGKVEIDSGGELCKTRPGGTVAAFASVRGGETKLLRNRRR
jgi:hypothetical protein